MAETLEKEINYEEMYCDTKAELDIAKEDIRIFKAMIEKLNKDNVDVCNLYEITALELEKKEV